MSMVFHSVYIRIEKKNKAVIFDEELANEAVPELDASAFESGKITSVQALADVIEKAVIVDEDCSLHEFINDIEEAEWQDDREYFEDDEEWDEEEEFQSSYDRFFEKLQAIPSLSEIRYVLVLCAGTLDGKGDYTWVLYTPKTGVCQTGDKRGDIDRDVLIRTIIG